MKNEIGKKFCLLKMKVNNLFIYFFSLSVFLFLNWS